MAKDKIFRWNEFNIYDEPNSKDNENAIAKTYKALLESMGIPFEEALEFARKNPKKDFSDLLKNYTKQFYEMAGIPEAQIQLLMSVKDGSGKIDKSIYKAIVQSFRNNLQIDDLQLEQYIENFYQAFEKYGFGARANVLTSCVIVGGYGNNPRSVNAHIGCGQGKTDISKGIALGKIALGKQCVITSSTPELASQSYNDLNDGFKDAKKTVLFISNDPYKASYTNENGEVISPLTKWAMSKFSEMANVIISDTMTLRENISKGFYKPDREKTSLLLDECDSEFCDEFYPVEIKGTSYSKEEQTSRVAARKIAAEVAKSLLAEMTIDTMSKTIVDKNGNSIDFSNIDVANIPEGFSLHEFQEFIIDAALAQNIYKENGVDFTITQEGIPVGINRATGAVLNLPEGITQAISIEQGLVPPEEKRVKESLTIIDFIDKNFGEIAGMSATYGDNPTDLLRTLATAGISPDLKVIPDIKKSEGIMPTINNLFINKVGTLRRAAILKQENWIKMIVADIEQSLKKGEAIIIATDSPQKTLEIFKALEQYPEYAGLITAYAGEGIAGSRGFEDLQAAPDPATSKLAIGKGKIVIGDQSIGRGVTPEDKDATKEHLIIAELPSRGDRHLSQFLGRVGRKKIDGNVSFILSKEDAVLANLDKEARRSNTGTGVFKYIKEAYSKTQEGILAQTQRKIELQKDILSTRTKLVEIGLIKARRNRCNDISDVKW